METESFWSDCSTNTGWLRLLAHLRVVERFGGDGGEGATAGKHHRLLGQHEELLLDGLLQLLPTHYLPIMLGLGGRIGGGADLIAHQRIAREEEVAEVVAEGAGRVSGDVVRHSLH